MKNIVDVIKKIDLSKAGEVSISPSELEKEVHRVVISYIEYRRWYLNGKKGIFPIEYRYRLYPLQESINELTHKLLFRYYIRGFFEILVHIYRDKTKKLKQHSYDKIENIFKEMSQQFGVNTTKAQKYLDKMFNKISVRDGGNTGGPKSAAAETIGKVLLHNAGGKTVRNLIQQSEEYTPLHFDPSSYVNNSNDFEIFGSLISDLGKPKQNK